ncbi:MAG: hypothetical protein A3E83_05170 [Gammaproteobacteria bacterium RIFCSPHIGHO2_12_FULL_41_20]|nr:MAG: hypothetical protein A3E83_05170 [Gammaproteobacteria bacterium RIFCSPHIGHO2_12_FULL_41_20]
MYSSQSHHHPRALPFLFLTEMWERFGFYVVQGLLILYMTQYFGFSDSASYTILGTFTALAYIAPIVGGFLADRLLGFKQAIIWGGLFLVLGYALMSLSTKASFYPALATIVVGNGLFKPNISSLLGTQYTIDNPRRDAGFTIFYVGINIGALLAGLSSGYIKDYFGWHVSFILASLGLIIGLSTFTFGLKYINLPESLLPLQKYRHLHSPWLIGYAIIAILLLSLLLGNDVVADWLLPSLGVVLLVFLTLLTLRQQPQYRYPLFMLIILILSSITFWMLFLQMFFSANLFIDRLVNKNLAGFHISTTVFYALESVFIILLGPLFAWIWQYLSQHNKNPSPINKFALGIFCAGCGFLILGISTLFANDMGLVNPLWIAAAYLLITIGELLLSPIGLSAVTLLSPPHLIGMMMGIWFVATGFGGIFAGWLAKLASVPEAVTTLSIKLAIYQHAFLYYAYIAFAMAVILFFVQLMLKKSVGTRVCQSIT